jgi:hypothetical protein
LSSGRTRIAKSRRRQRRQAALYDPEQNSWKKYAKCSICRRAFCVNNYPDRKVRVSKDKIGGKIVCAWCKDRDGKFVVQLMLACEKWTLMMAPHVEEHPDCKCTVCQVDRILKRHDELPVRR